MQHITISGTLLDDAEKCTDKDGRNYIRFSVSCGDSTPGGRTEFTHYNCTCYIMAYEGMRKGDQVFITGRFSPRLRKDDKGRSYMNLNIMVHQINGGRKAADKQKDNGSD